jgi:hypothetical protein
MVALPGMRDKKKTGEPSWGWRRGLVIVAVLFCFWQLIGLRSAADTRVNETLAAGYLTLTAVLVLTYSGLATAQDIAAIFATRSALPYSPRSSPAEPTPGTEANPPRTEAGRPG